MGGHSQHPEIIDTTTMDVEQPSAFFQTVNMPVAMTALDISIAAIYITCAAVWHRGLHKNRSVTTWTHYWLLALFYLKALDVATAVLVYVLRKYLDLGASFQSIMVLQSILTVVRGPLAFGVLVVLGAGWTMGESVAIRTRRVYLLVLVIVLLQLVGQILAVVGKHTAKPHLPGEARSIPYSEAIFAMDILCCSLVLFPAAWTICHLTKASKTGNSAGHQAMQSTLKYYYITLLVYIYFTRIMAFILQTTLPTVNWHANLTQEVCTVALYIMLGWLFWPRNNRPSDSDMASEKILVHKDGGDIASEV